MKIGNVSITKEDRYNWVVKYKHMTTYFGTLPAAVEYAVTIVSETDARELKDWLSLVRQQLAELKMVSKSFVVSTDLEPAKNSPKSKKSKKLSSDLV